MYIIYALLGALMAALGTIFAKFGLKDVDSTLLTSLRGIVMALIVTFAAVSLGKVNLPAISTITNKEWFYIIASGIAGGLSWLFFFHALSIGTVIHVTVIDKLSLILTAVLALLLLGEGITLQAGLGFLLIMAGTLLVVFK